ncbi:MAG: hypothetical protein NTY98_16445 [Verrucomicrobia bacterium]|nr:hypothetical protein [Verrucomicrobiota bacterium]
MNKPIKWTAAVAISVIGLVSIVAMIRHKSANSLNPKILKWDQDHGFVFPIPEKRARFMGLPMFLAISTGMKGPTNEDLDRSTKALSALPQ